MKQERFLLALAVLLATMGWGRAAEGQNPTAVQAMQLSAFGGATGVYPGLGGGKNFSITAGVDLALQPYHGVRPTIELRGTYPTDRGLIDHQKSLLGGLRVDFLLGHRIHPYADFLFGRGEMVYSPSFYLYNGFYYELTTTYVYSPGAGFDYDLGQRWGIKVDGQVQRWGSTPTPSGEIFSKVGTVGVVYRFNFSRRSRR
jgi:hypothetical protein